MKNNFWFLLLVRRIKKRKMREMQEEWEMQHHMRMLEMMNLFAEKERIE